MRTARFVALLAAGLLAAACAGGAGDGTAEADRLVVQVSGEAEETAVYDSLVQEFEAANEGIDVELVKYAEKSDHLTALATSFSAGDPPDVFLVNFREYSQFVARGAIEPIESHLARAGIELADYYEPPIEAFTYDGELQCMPQNISSLVVYYNIDLFARAGLEPPRAGWTWDDFRATAKELTAGDVYGLGIEPNVIRIAPFVWSNGGDIVDDLWAPTRFTFDQPEARAALEFIVSLVRDDRVVPSEQELVAQDLETRFAAGKLGMLLSSRRDTPVFREVAGLNFDVAALPVAKEPASILHSDGYCIAAASERVADAARFIAYAIGPEGQTLTALAGRTVPSLKEVATSGAFLDPAQQPASSQVFLDSIPHIRRTPVIPTWTEIEEVAEEILTRAFYDPGYTIDDALRELDEATRPLFEEASG
jgi:multiple sugar transport system substrate-binding protein